jgi:uncharacterized membrane protein
VIVSRFRSWRAEWIVWAMIMAYVAFFALLTLQKHNAFQTTAFDLGNVDQAVWNTRHGRILAMTNIEGLTNRLGTHVEPILLPVSLLYFLWSDPRALLLLQTIIIALGAWPVFLITQHAMRNAPRATRDVLSVLFALVYLLFPALQSANTFDFHAVSLAPTFFLFAFYFLEKQRWGLYALFCVLTMSCKEDMPLLVVMLGLYALIVRRRWLVGSLTIASALVWFFLAVGVVMPHFDPQGVAPLANRYAYLGGSPLEIVLALFTQPGLVLEHLLTAQNLVYIRDLLVPVAFLSLLAPQVLILALPTLLINLLSSDGLMHQLQGFHYAAPLAPIVVVSAAYAAAWLIRRLPRFRYLPLILASLVLLATIFYHYGHGYTPLAADFRGNWPTVTGHHRLGEEIALRIPADASLAVLPHPNPHSSQRQQLAMIDRVDNGLPAPLNGADYVWLDVTNGWPLHPNDLKQAIENLLAGDYGIDRAGDGWLLLRRGAPEKMLPDAFYDFVRISSPRPQFPMRLQFLLDGEPVLESLGFDLILQDQGLRRSTGHSQNPQSPVSSLRLYWRALQPLPPGLSLYPFFFDDATGQILEDTSLRPMIASVWYPPEDWRPGEIVMTSTLPWDVGSDYGIGLGAMQGDNWSDIERRLPIQVESSDLVVRLFDGDTWARLIGVASSEPVEEHRVFAAPAPQHPLDADFDGKLRLLGYDLECDQQAAACELQLYWQAQKPLGASYTTFVQMLGPADQVRAQADAVPRDGGYPTAWWLPGEVVADTHTLELPAGAPANAIYRLIVGWYDPETGIRLPVSGHGTDSVELTAIEFEQ